MSKNASLYQSVSISGDSVSWNIGSTATPITTVGNSCNEHIVSYLASGFTTILVPQLPNPAVFVDIVPPTNSVVSLQLMGNTNDVGISLFAGLPSRIALAASQTSLIIKAGGSTNCDFYFY